jgi:hypothetical protein
MTDRMREEELDHAIRNFLAWQAEDIADAPTATKMAARISSRAGTRMIVPRLAPRLAWVLLAGLLLLALISTLVAGASLLRHDPMPISYEAVFLRLEVVAQDSPEVLVVGVNSEGRERQIARLPGGWVAYHIPSLNGYLQPMGAVSPTGLLAVPRGGADLMMSWEIVDLHRSNAPPILVAGMEQFIEQLRETPYWHVHSRGGVFWGPGERLANLWYPPGGGEVHLQLGIIDGRTGRATAVTIPEGLVVLPYWASDGSGIFVGSSATDATLRRLLRLNGTVVDAPAALAESSCRAPKALESACLAPNDSMIVEIGGDTTTPHRVARLIAQGTGASFQIQGSFAGWLEVAP